MEEDKVVVLSPESDRDFLTEVKARAEIYPKLLNACLANTLATDWVDFGGKPYLKDNGAMRVAVAMGFTVRVSKRERVTGSDEKGPWFMWVFEGQVGLERYNIWIDTVGACSSRKQFYWSDKGRQRDLWEISEPNVMKDAYADMVGNGIKTFLGLKDLTWPDLEALGIQRGKGGRVEFRASKDKPQPPGKASSKPASKASSPEKPVGPSKTDAPSQGNPPPEAQASLIADLKAKAQEVVEANAAAIDNTTPDDLLPIQVNNLLRQLEGVQGKITLKEYATWISGQQKLWGQALE